MLWAGGVLLAALLAIAAAEMAGWPFLRGPVQQQLQQRLQAPVVLQAPFRLQLLWRPGVAVSQVTLGASPGVGVDTLLQADALQLRWRWAELWSRQDGQPWPLREVSAQRLQANLVRLADGRASWPAGPVRPAADGSQPPFEMPVSVGLLRLVRGDIVLRDAITTTDVRVQMDGEQVEGGDSRLTASAQGSWRGRPLTLRASAGGSSALVEDSGPVPVSLRGRIVNTEFSFRGVAADLLSARNLRGSLLVRGPSLAAVGDALGVTLPTTPPFRLAAALTHDAGLWTVVTTQARVGGSRLQADLKYDTRPPRAMLTGRLGGEMLRLKDLGPAIGTAVPADTPALSAVLEGADASDIGTVAPRAAAAGKARAGRVLPDRSFDLRALNAMDADVQVAIATLDLGDDAIIAPLQALAAHLVLNKGRLSLDGLRAQVAGGRMTGSTSLATQPDSAVARWQADLRFDGLRLEQWLRSLQRKGKPLVTGRLAARLQVSGVGGSTAALLAGLQGQAGASLRQGTVSHLVVEMAGLDVAESLGVYVRGDDALPLTCAVVQGPIQKGLFRTQQAFIDTRDSSVRITGQMNLSDETLAMRAEVKPKDFSPFSLRAPLLVGGTLAQPDVTIEKQRLVGRVAAALALGAVAGPAALLPFLDFGSEPGKANNPCAAAR